LLWVPSHTGIPGNEIAQLAHVRARFVSETCKWYVVT
jgi:hypothetical protein